ncbi:class I SAM-dependent rRNA methyltransferase [bacterium]|nr:class I SAM-dependent rRNA methyltransferase [bacterium]
MTTQIRKLTVTLEKGRERLAKNHNPWVYSKAVKHLSDGVSDGDTVAVLDFAGNFVAWGHYNGKSGIALRLLEWDEAKFPNENWIREKVEAAVALRKRIIPENTEIFRLIFSESDMLPGIVCDVFENVGVLQISTPAFERIKTQLAEIIAEAAELEAVYEKSDGDGRKIEGLPEKSGFLYGKHTLTKIVSRETNLFFEADLEGQKTGFYADQRDNRRFFGEAAEGEVLDICAFSGAFSVHALKNGAEHATLLDISKESEALIRRNMELNSIDPARYTFIKGDVFELLRKFAADGKKFDSVVLDPPKLVPSNKYLEKGLRAYKDLNFNALKLVRKGGIFATFSCSGAVTLADFRNAVAFAAHDAGLELKILRQLHQAPDHPIRVSAPETEYLKGLLLQVGE